MIGDFSRNVLNGRHLDRGTRFQNLPREDDEEKLSLRERIRGWFSDDRKKEQDPLEGENKGGLPRELENRGRDLPAREDRSIEQDQQPPREREDKGDAEGKEVNREDAQRESRKNVEEQFREAQKKFEEREREDQKKREERAREERKKQEERRREGKN